jgi:hypothetical protein
MPSRLGPSMTAEQRLDRLERIAKLFVTAGLRARRNMREMDEKIKILIDAQIQNEGRVPKFDERFAKFDERLAKFDERSAKYDVLFAKHAERFAKSDERFKKFEAWTDQTLKILMELVRERNGRS